MVSGSNEQHSPLHGNENQDFCQITEVVQRQHQIKKTEGREREKEKTELGGDCLGECRAASVDQAVKERNVEPLLDKPYGSGGVESGRIRKSSGGHDRGCLNRQIRQGSKHIIGKAGDDEPQIIPSELQRPVLRTTSIGKHTHTRHSASS